jgi:hypothetical protein
MRARADLAGESTWTDLGTSPTLQAILGVLVLGILIAVAFYLVARFRDYAAGDRPQPDSLRSNFQEMLRRGEITEAEYRMIQSKSYGDSIAAASHGATLGGDRQQVRDDASRSD